MRISGKEYNKAAHARLLEAEILRKNEKYHTSIYLLGYVLECILGYLYCARNGATYLDEVKGYDSNIWYDHAKLTEKFQVLGLYNEFRSEIDKFRTAWSVEMRYQSNNFIGKEESAQDIIDAAIYIFKKIKSRTA